MNIPGYFFGVGALYMVGCAVHPNMDKLTSDPGVQCLLAFGNGTNPDIIAMQPALRQALAADGVTCTPEMIAAGGRAVLAEVDRVRSANNARTESFNAALRAAANTALAVGAGYAAAQAMRPPPPPPPAIVQCRTTSNGYTAFTTCY